MLYFTKAYVHHYLLLLVEIDAARKQFEAKFAALRPQHPPQAGVPLSPERNLRRSTGSRKVL